MRNITKVLAKEVRRVRVLVDMAEKNGIHYSQATKELRSLKWILALLIRRAL